MRLANISKTLLLLALSAVAVTSAGAQVSGVTPATVRDQLNKSTAAPQSNPAPAKPTARSARAQSSAPATHSAEKPAEQKTPGVRRDPFDILLNKARAGAGEPENLPPGMAGLVVDTLRIDGIVQGKNGMIAIVSNPQQRVYFVREGDKLYDGNVEHITLDGVSFHEVGKDAFGKPVEREVTKRLYAVPGEQQ